MSLVVRVGEEGYVRVPANFFSVRFGICESASMLTEEVLQNYGIV